MQRPGLIQTLRTPGVIMGFIAMALIGISMLTPGFAPSRGLAQIQAIAALRKILEMQVGRVLLIIGLALLFWAWIKLRPALHDRLNHGLILVLWSLPILVVPPVFSTDAFLYADQGWIISQGHDPYEVGLTDAGGPFAANVHPVWAHTTAVYPPAALLVQYLVTEATGYRGLISVIAMRIPAILGVGVIAFMVAKVARQLHANVELAKWFAVINPFLIIHFVGGMHNDIWMIALVMVAAWLALRFGIGGMLAGSVLVGIGAAFKQPGIAAAIAIGLLPIAARLRQMDLGRRILTMAAYCATAVIIAVGTFVAVSFAIGYKFLGWSDATGIHEVTWGFSPASILEQIVGPFARAIGIDRPLLPVITPVATLVAVLIGAWLAWRYFFADKIVPRTLKLNSLKVVPGGEIRETDRSWQDHPLRWLAWFLTALGLGGAGFHVWYMVWGGLYLGMFRYGNRAFRGFIAVMIALVVVEGALEYFGLRPIPGYLLGATLGWIFWVNSSALQIVPEPDPDDTAAEAEGAVAA